jgi:hypothetical protein
MLELIPMAIKQMPPIPILQAVLDMVWQIRIQPSQLKSILTLPPCQPGQRRQETDWQHWQLLFVACLA